jgi:hypothetical protein
MRAPRKPSIPTPICGRIPKKELEKRSTRLFLPRSLRGLWGPPRDKDPGHRPSDGEPACRRGSVRPEGRGGHPSKRPTWGLPPRRKRAGHPCPTFGLAPGGVYRAARVTPGAGALLPHRFTIACAGRDPPSAVCFLLHFPSGRPDWPLASTLPCGAPTFLDITPDEGDAAATRPTHRRPPVCQLRGADSTSRLRRDRTPSG